MENIKKQREKKENAKMNTIDGWLKVFSDDRAFVE